MDPAAEWWARVQFLCFSLSNSISFFFFFLMPTSRERDKEGTSTNLCFANQTGLLFLFVFHNLKDGQEKIWAKSN
jgi:hypothetical protein